MKNYFYYILLYIILKLFITGIMFIKICIVGIYFNLVILMPQSQIWDLHKNNSKSTNSSNVCGVLPYIAPEVLDGRPYTFASDIYSFGIIMVEMSTGKPPYGSVPHDEKLALVICNGLRPRVSKGTPQYYIDVINQCLDVNPEKRPSVYELRKTIGN